MAVAQVREQDVEALLASGALSVTGAYTWQHSSHKSWIRAMLPVTVQRQKPPTLRIVATVPLQRLTRFNFVLLWNNVRVRGLCIEGSHTNRHTNDERWIHQTHKHRWSDVCQDRFAYTPTDITAVDAQGLLAQFCAECGIDCTATLAEVPEVQRGLYDDL
jgi:hypothetical protein